MIHYGNCLPIVPREEDAGGRDPDVVSDAGDRLLDELKAKLGDPNCRISNSCRDPRISPGPELPDNIYFGDIALTPEQIKAWGLRKKGTNKEKGSPEENGNTEQGGKTKQKGIARKGNFDKFKKMLLDKYKKMLEKDTEKAHCRWPNSWKLSKLCRDRKISPGQPLGDDMYWGDIKLTKEQIKAWRLEKKEKKKDKGSTKENRNTEQDGNIEEDRNTEQSKNTMLDKNTKQGRNKKKLNESTEPGENTKQDGNTEESLNTEEDGNTEKEQTAKDDGKMEEDETANDKDLVMMASSKNIGNPWRDPNISPGAPLPDDVWDGDMKLTPEQMKAFGLKKNADEDVNAEEEEEED